LFVTIASTERIASFRVQVVDPGVGAVLLQVGDHQGAGGGVGDVAAEFLERPGEGTVLRRLVEPVEVDLRRDPAAG
jgi:hypothetical protein